VHDRFSLAVVSHPDAKCIAHWAVGDYVIGRGDDVDIYIPSPNMSRHHAIIEVRFDAIFIVDLGSSNGSFIDDDRMHNSRARLPSGCRIALGSYPATFFWPPEQLEVHAPHPVLCLGCRYPHHPDEPDWLLDFERDFTSL
jgi:hypothetical protein